LGVTNHLELRIYQHREGSGLAFTHKYNCHELVYYETYQDIRAAIDREKQLKHWNRAWKLELIRKDNPEMNDLAAKWFE
jgi:putative endonuclease